MILRGGGGRFTGEKPSLDQLQFTVSVAVVTDSDFEFPLFLRQVAVNPAIGVRATTLTKRTSQSVAHFTVELKSCQPLYPLSQTGTSRVTFMQQQILSRFHLWMTTQWKLADVGRNYGHERNEKKESVVAVVALCGSTAGTLCMCVGAKRRNQDPEPTSIHGTELICFSWWFGAACEYDECSFPVMQM